MKGHKSWGPAALRGLAAKGLHLQGAKWRGLDRPTDVRQPVRGKEKDEAVKMVKGVS